MSLLFIDGFDHCNPITYPILKQDNGQNSVSSYQNSTGGRFGTGCIVGISSTLSTMYKTLNCQHNSIIVGFAISQCGSSNIMNLLSLYNDSTAYITLSRTSNSIFVSSGDSTLFTFTDATFISENWFYLELKAVIDSTNGIIQVRSNDRLIIDLTNINTQVGSVASINKIGFNCGSDMSIKLDDVYICDLTGNINNDFLGECRIDCINPIANGSHSKQDATGGLSYQCVDDATLNQNTDFISTSRLFFGESWIYSNLPSDTTDSILGLQVNMVTKRSTSGVPLKIQPFVRKNNINFYQTEFSLDTSYKSSNTIVELDPIDSSYQTKLDLSNTEFGLILSNDPTAPAYSFIAQEVVDIITHSNLLENKGMLAESAVDFITKTKNIRSYSHISQSIIESLSKTITNLNTGYLTQSTIDFISKTTYNPNMVYASQSNIESISKYTLNQNCGFLSQYAVDVISYHKQYPYTSISGGTITTDGTDRIHTFLLAQSGTKFVTPIDLTATVLVVAGGGGGGARNSTYGYEAGGGGAGGLLYRTNFTISKGEYTVTVGDGGTGSVADSNQNGVNGGNSIFSSLTAIGGGGGAQANKAANSGGSGGGASHGGGAPGSGTTGQGNAGGVKDCSGNNAGGGGGAGEAGNTDGCGCGGDGLQYSISGTATQYAGGGRGFSGDGGLGGGGGSAGAAGTSNTGGGGAGNSNAGGVGGKGGSGIVIIRYRYLYE